MTNGQHRAKSTLTVSPGLPASFSLMRFCIPYTYLDWLQSSTTQIHPKTLLRHTRRNTITTRKCAQTDSPHHMNPTKWNGSHDCYQLCTHLASMPSIRFLITATSDNSVSLKTVNSSSTIKSLHSMALHCYILFTEHCDVLPTTIQHAFD